MHVAQHNELVTEKGIPVVTFSAMVSGKNSSDPGPPRTSLRSRKQGLQLTLLPEGPPRKLAFVITKTTANSLLCNL